MFHPHFEKSEIEGISVKQRRYELKLQELKTSYIIVGNTID